MKPLALIFNNAKASKLLVLRKDGPVDANGPPILLKPHFFYSCGTVEKDTFSMQSCELLSHCKLIFGKNSLIKKYIFYTCNMCKIYVYIKSALQINR